MNNTNPYFKELDEIHVEIAALFDGSAEEGALECIMARFAPWFALVKRAALHGGDGSRCAWQGDMASFAGNPLHGMSGSGA